MQAGNARTATEEWRAHWPLTLAAMVGFSTIGLQSYGLGPFVVHLEREFGWTRAEVMTGLSLSNLVGVFLHILVGLLVDRVGPRSVGLVGIAVKTGAFALLATATGTVLNWSMLWLLIAVGVVLVQSTVWTSAVAARFDSSRGLAMAVVLSGAPITAMLCPLVATWLIENFGLRAGFAGVGAIWFAVSLPTVFLLFKNPRRARAQDLQGGSAPEAPVGLTLRQGIMTRAFVCLLISFAAFSFYAMTLSTNLVPLLGERGVTPMQAASIASLMGLAGIVARLSVGVLLDRFAGAVVGAATQMLPVVGCVLLLSGEVSTPGIVVAVVAFGAAIGAEMDVALYLATRHFGLQSFAALFGAVITFGALTAAAGPMIGGWLHDMTNSYDSLLVIIVVVMIVGAAAIALIGNSSAGLVRNATADGQSAT